MASSPLDDGDILTDSILAPFPDLPSELDSNDTEENDNCFEHQQPMIIFAMFCILIIITESDCESHFSMTSNSDDQDCDDDHFLKSDGTDNDSMYYSLHN